MAKLLNLNVLNRLKSKTNQTVCIYVVVNKSHFWINHNKIISQWYILKPKLYISNTLYKVLTLYERYEQWLSVTE